MLQLMVDDIFMTVAAEDRVILEFSDLNQTVLGAQKVMASRHGLML